MHSWRMKGSRRKSCCSRRSMSTMIENPPEYIRTDHNSEHSVALIINRHPLAIAPHIPPMIIIMIPPLWPSTRRPIPAYQPIIISSRSAANPSFTPPPARAPTLITTLAPIPMPPMMLDSRPRRLHHPVTLPIPFTPSTITTPSPHSTRLRAPRGSELRVRVIV